MSHSDVRINGGFFVCRRELLDWIEPGDELVEETFARLIPRGEVVAFPYEGFFGPMDTIKDRQRLEALHESGRAPWRRVGLRRRNASRGPLMLALRSRRRTPLRRVLAIGCHADDIEIGCGGTLLALTRAQPELEVHLGRARRARVTAAAEARASAEAFLAERRRAPRSWSTAFATRSCRTTARRSRRPSRS